VDYLCEDGFLALSREHCDPRTAGYVVLPLAYEATVSYEAGTARGPAAIISASHQVELLDEQTMREIHRAGVATVAPSVLSSEPAEAMGQIEALASELTAPGRFVLALGGEHGITPPLVRCAQAVHGPVSVLQIDAHADLRDTYDGTPHSHASAMRRVLEITDRLVQVGIRSISPEELAECPSRIEAAFTPGRIARDPHWIARVVEALDERVYVTIDIDGLDPSLVPGTGTPEPGGLGWYETIDLLRAVCSARRVVGADLVEVRPIPPHHVTEFVAARLACKLIAYTQDSSAG
jgi:agmatinase